MKLISLCMIALVLTLSAKSAQFKCYSSKYPAMMSHFFEDGYTVLNIKENNVNLKYFYKNNAGKYNLSINADYDIAGVNTGNGSLKDMVFGDLVDYHSYPGDSINRIHFSKSLFENTNEKGIVGKFVFPGHGYSYDWNICYNLK